jgi:SAM-dependent methyltransferase
MTGGDEEASVRSERMRPHWDAKADRWDGHLPRTELFAELRETVLWAARPTRRDVAIDLGSGSGFLTIPFAGCVRRLYAVDHSEKMLSRLGDKLANEGLRAYARLGDLRTFAPPEPVDIVVSNYALHHLRHPAKLELLRRCRTWMSPGGRIVVADLMVPLTLRPGQSDALLRKVRSIAAKGVPGYWRIAKNAVRWTTGRGEYPASLEFWIRALGEAGFEDVGGRRVGAESGVAWGTRR